MSVLNFAEVHTDDNSGTAGTPQFEGQQPAFTCLICLLAFFEPDAQRAHFSSDHHRYNAKVSLMLLLVCGGKFG